MSPTAASIRFIKLSFLSVAAWAVIVLLLFFLPGNTLMDRFELRTLDWRFHRRGELEPSNRILIVAVDDVSIREIGRWPWSRQRAAELVNRLQAAGAERIIFDIFFVDEDMSPGGAVADRSLVQATQAAGIVYHSGYVHDVDSSHTSDTSPDYKAVALSPDAYHIPTGWRTIASLIEPPAVALPLPSLLEAARGVGVANVLDSGDGLYRHLVPVIRVKDQIIPSIALIVSADLLGVSRQDIQIYPGSHIQLGQMRRIPIDSEGRMLINFMGGSATYPYLSAAEVMNYSGKTPDKRLQGKTILVGVTAPGIYDLRAAPYDTIFNGVETEANAIDNILTDRFLFQVHPFVTGLGILFFSIVLAWLLPRVATVSMCLLALAGVIGYPWLCVYLFSKFNLVLHVIAPVMMSAGTLIIMLALRLGVEERRRHQAQGVLRHFVPPQLVNRLVEDEAVMTLRGERREISVFFADIRHFTSSAEELAPEDTVSFLNRYFELMNEVIWENEGTLDKYIGDEIMVFYNAPLIQDDHVRRAVMTAIEMQQRIAANGAEWEYLGMPDLHAGIGIATGPAVVGYVGSGERMQYTVIGRTVNLASRLQAHTKVIGCRILIDHATYLQVRDIVETQDIGLVTLPGIHEPVRVWNVLAKQPLAPQRITTE